jgi:hypothetical protein
MSNFNWPQYRKGSALLDEIWLTQSKGYSADQAVELVAKAHNMTVSDVESAISYGSDEGQM